MNYYLLLGVPRDADADTIRSAFRALARRYHPDAGEGSCADRFREILTAYETLNNPTLRGQYDRILQNRRAHLPELVEPLRAQSSPEPLLGRRLGAMHTQFVYDPLWTTHLDELIDELFQPWDEAFLGAPRRRDRL
jgi:curved DNA-binding protein CbpA